MADLSSILGGMVQGFKDFGTGLVDMFGTGGAAIGDAIASIQSGRATTKNQDDFRKWLYNTDSTKDAAAKGLGTALNGVSTVADVIPGAQAVTANPLFNGLQGAIGGISDELKMNGENADWGRAAQRAGVGAASGLASAYAGQGLAKTGNKLLSNGLTRGAISGALGGGIANAGYTGIEGGSVQDMINAGLYGAQTGALVGGTTGLARELIKPTHKMDVALTDDEKAARIANAKNMLANEQNPERIAELNEQIKKYGGATAQPDYLGDEKYSKLVKKAKGYKSLDRFEKMNNPIKGSEIWGEKPKSYFERDSRAVRINMFPNDATKGTGLTKQYLLNMFKDAYDDGITHIVPSYGSYTKEGASFMNHLADQGWVKQNGRNGYNSYEVAPKIAEWQKTNPLADIYNAANSTAPKALEKTVADLMNEPKQKTVADLMLSPEQEEFFKNSKLRDENGKLVKMYHGTPDGSFTEFNEGSYFTPNKEYADGYQWEGASVLRSNKKAVNPKTYEVYINTEKPFTLSDPKARDIYLNEYIKGGNSMYYDPYTDWTKAVNDLSEVDWTEGEDLRAWLKENHPEYDALYLDEGGDGGYGEAEYKWRGNSVVPFNANQIKSVDNLKPTADADILASAALPGSNKKAKTSNGVKRIGSDNVAPVDESTLPKGWKELRDILDEKYVDDITKKFGYENGDFSKITPEQYEKYILDVQTSPGKKKGWQNQFEFKKSYMDADEYKNELKNIAMYEAKRKAINDIQDMDLPQAQKNAIDTAINSMDYYATDDNRRYLSHYMPGGEEQKMFANNAASEADAEFSDRLGIGRSNTIKRNNIWSKDLNADGEYKPDEYALAVDPLLNKENAVSTLAHERLHSFQFEAPQGRYDKRVLDAYNELSKDLKPYIHDQATVDERYGKYYKDNLDGKYWGSNIEQESRMMQQYLDNKGYTNRTVDGPRKNEYGEEINKAFDKFFKKLRTLSKKGVALPAITALLGGGAIMAATQSDDKKKKSEVK